MLSAPSDWTLRSSRLSTSTLSLLAIILVVAVLTAPAHHDMLPEILTAPNRDSRSADLSLTAPPEVVVDPEWREAAAPADLALRGLPPELEGTPELMAFRTGNSATFEIDPEQYKTIISADSLHYRGQDGTLQIIDPSFHLEESGYMVQHNSIRSKAGLQEAWLSATSGGASIHWETLNLSTIGLPGSKSMLAERLSEGGSVAEQLDRGQILSYQDGWTDKSLSEQFISAPDSVEHILVLESRPDVTGNPDWLALEARLDLFPGTTLWVDGKQQSAAFETAGSIEVRDADGKLAFVLDPVLAFEMENPESRVAGQYVARPTGDEGAWIIGLRTPWEWWADAARQYPAAIDPTMRVLRTSGGGGTGMAWLGNGGDAPNLNYQMGHMVLGSMVSVGYFGFMQFNVMPALLTNHPLQVADAQLLITPSYYHMPSYKHDSDDGPDWEKKTISHSATLWEVQLDNICPDPLANPNCWSMIDNRLGTDTGTFNWNTKPEIGNASETTELDTQTLSVGPASQGGKGNTTSYDVTGTVRDWYNVSPQPNHGPAFMIRHNSEPCIFPSPAPAPQPPPYQIEGWPSMVPPCTRFNVSPSGAQLHITYNALQLNLGQSMMNRPGVPSFYEGILADSNHQYKLATNPGSPAWRAVAIRGNHHLTQSLPARADLKLLDFTSGDPEILLENTQSTKDDQTSYVLINDHACASSGICGSGVDLRAESIATNANNYPDDQERNYRIEYQVAQHLNIQYGTNAPVFITDYGSDELMRMVEFDLAQYDSLGIIVTGHPNVEPGLVAPTNDGDPIDAIISNKFANTSFGYIGGIDDSSQRSLAVTDIEKAGVWGLVLANQEAPIPDVEIPTQAKKYGFTLDIMRCPWGTIPTIKWECQPVIIPDAGTPSRTVLGLDIYSEGGFNDLGGGSWCSTNEGQGTPMIGPAVDDRWTVVGQGSICWDETNDFLTTSQDSGIGIAVPHPLGATRGRVSPAFMYGDTMTSLPLPAGVETGVVGFSAVTSGQIQPTPTTRVNIAPYEQYWSDTLSNVDHYIDPSLMKIIGGGTISAEVTIDAADDPVTIEYDVPWEVYPGAASSYIFNSTPVQTPVFHAPASFVDISSLQLRLIGDGGDGRIQDLDTYKLTLPYAWQFREAKAQVTQDPTMGGATRGAQAVVLPPGAPRLPASEAGAKSCTWVTNSQVSSCLDIRYTGYGFLNGDGDKQVPMWELPDIHIQDEVATLLLSRPGEVLIFSEDHPDSALTPQQIGQSFSFDTWNADVTLDQAKCFPGDPTETTVIRGEALIGLPTVGETGVPPSVKLAFKLCDTSLAEATLELEIPKPGIPVGSSGAGVSLIGGTVTIGPESTQIEINVEFQTLDQATLTNGFGTVLIDTAGLFQLTAGAEIVGVLDANLLMKVAWQPLDILLQASVTCCGGLVGGELYMHAWIGQGFQNAYPWLPDNNDFHFAGYVEAFLYIPEAYVIPLLPPFDITISLKIAFGEFCTNSSCTNYDWGMSATLTIAGVGVGFYVDSSGPEFFFGSGSHTLIDQFGGARLVEQQQFRQQLARNQTLGRAPVQQIVTPGDLQLNLMPVAENPTSSWPVQTPAGAGCTGSAMGPTLDCVFNISNSEGSAYFNVMWQNGDLDITLTAPDATVITYTNAMTYGVTISETVSAMKQVSFSLEPLPGQETVIGGNWTLTIDNIGGGIRGGLANNYQIMMFTDPPPPSFEWTTPVFSDTMPVGSSVNLEWDALRAGQALDNSVEMELIFTPVISRPVDLTEFNGALIASRIKANAGSYSWDISRLAAGEYAVAARLDDRFTGNGTVVSWAPGTILIEDTTPPPAPTILNATPVSHAVILEFQRPNTPDLAGYLIEYTYPQPDGSVRITNRRINPRGKWYEYFNGQQIWFDGTEEVRLGLLMNNFTTDICVRAYDNSANVGPCSNIQVEIPRAPDEPMGPPENLATAVVGDDLKLSWDVPATGPTVHGYLVAYAPHGCDMPEVVTIANEGASPLDVGNVLTINLSGLTPGQLYAVGVAAYDANDSIGPVAATIARFGDMTDGDADGLPDAWADAWGVSGEFNDPDQDGADNGSEFDNGSNPLHADSDLDGFYDGEELENGTDLCSSADHPSFQTQPKITLYGPQLPAFQVSVNQSAVLSKTVNVFNLGGGSLSWTATTTAPWLNLSQSGNTLHIGVDTSVLASGHFTDVIIYRNTSRSTIEIPGRAPLAIQETYTMPVEILVHPEQQFDPAVAPLVSVEQDSVDDNDLILSWDHDGAHAYYQVYEDTRPYFIPAANDLLSTVSPPGGYTHQEALFERRTIYYLVRSTGYGGDTVLSNRVAAFEFDIVPGSE